jgi:hypothetical protein
VNHSVVQLKNETKLRRCWHAAQRLNNCIHLKTDTGEIECEVLEVNILNFTGRFHTLSVSIDWIVRIDLKYPSDTEKQKQHSPELQAPPVACSLIRLFCDYLQN